MCDDPRDGNGERRPSGTAPVENAPCLHNRCRTRRAAAWPLSMERFREHEAARHIVLFLYNKAGSPSRRRQVRGKAEGQLATPLMTKTPKRSGDLANGETSEGEPTQPMPREGVANALDRWDEE